MIRNAAAISGRVCGIAQFPATMNPARPESNNYEPMRRRLALAIISLRQNNISLSQENIARSMGLGADRLRKLENGDQFFSAILENRDILAQQKQGKQSPVGFGTSQRTVLSAEQEIALAALAEAGDKSARQAIINSGFRLVASAAKKIKHDGISRDDLIQEGNIGLITAAAKFDYRKGVRFSTYANFWIKHYIIRAIQNHGSTLRVPVYIQEMSSKIKGAAAKLAGQLGRAPTDEEIDAVIFNQKRSYRVSKKTAGEVRAARNTGATLSLDQHFFEYPDNVGPDPETLLEKREFQVKINSALSALSARDREFIGLYFYGGKKLKEIGESHGITGERVRQIIKDTLILLREKRPDLRDYIG